MFAALLAALLATTVYAEPTYTFHCTSSDGSRCPAPPAPPAPPAAPAPPAVPAPPVPELPPVPEPPPLPKIPDGAQAACANAKEGTRITWVIRPGEVMRGTCHPADGKMAFSLESYRIDD